MKDPLQDDIRFQIPVKISYTALEGFLRQQLVGEHISTTGENGEETKYATFLDVDLAKSHVEGYDLAVDVKFKTLTTFFRNKEGSILLDVSLHFEPGSQKLSVKDYKFDVESSSWLLNNSLETLAGTFFRDKIKKRMNFDFRPLIAEQLGNINKKLESSIEPAEGVSLSGFVTDFRILQLLPGEKVLLAIVEVQGRMLVEVNKIDIGNM